jgi:basic amino acid/polyamine antiporter, APA family
MSSTKPALGQLSRILGLGFGVAVIFGGTVGVGILRLPGEIAGKLGSAWLVMLVWALGGAYALLGAISLSELGAALPQAGGFYVYSKRAFGPATGFVMGWADWLNNCASASYVSVAAAEYLLVLAPVHDEQGRLVQTAVALGLVGLFGVVQWFGLRLSSGVQKATSSLTAIIFLVLAAACLLHKKAGAMPGMVSSGAAGAGALGHGGLLSIAVTMVAVLPAIVVAYDGWYEAIYFTEEDTNPAKHLPRAMIGGVLLISGLYLLLNLAYVHVLSIPTMAASKLVAADAARIVFPAPAFIPNLSGAIITLLSLMTLLGCLNAQMMGAPRVLFGVGRDGLFRGAAKVAEGGTPRTALMASAVMAAILVASGKLDEIIGVSAILIAATYTVNYIAVIVLRMREPRMERPFRAWGYPVSTAAVLLASAAFLVVDVKADPVSAVRAAVLVAVALPVYGWSRWRMRVAG